MSDSQPAGRRGLRLLSLDGGGIRGLSCLLILKEILERYKNENNLQVVPKPCEVFDLAGGTSTGGLIVIMLFRLQMSVDQAIKAYVELAKHVFSEKQWFFQTGTFKVSRLEEAILRVIKRALNIESDEEALGLRLLDENLPKCFVCSATAINLSSPTLFRSWKPSKFASYLRTTIIEAARATTAAPNIFQSVSIDGDEGLTETFVDGGLLANNPAKLVRDQAKDLFPNSRIDYILSLGTGVPSVIKLLGSGDNIFKRLVPSNIMVVKALIKIATDCETTADEVGRTFSNTPDVYYRFSVDRGLGKVSLSEWDKLPEVKTHTDKYLQRLDLEEKVDKLVKKLYETRT